MSDQPPHPKILNLRDSVPVPVVIDGARGATGRPLLERSEGKGELDFRVVSLGPGGVSADHTHSWEQTNFVLSGTGTVRLGDETHAVAADDFIYVPPNVGHVYVNTGSDDLVLITVLGPRG